MCIRDRYKSFKTLEEAEAFVGAEGTSRKRSEKAEKPDTGKQEQNPAVYAFVDGSYNIATKVYGYGGFLIHNGEKEVLQGSGNDAEMASMRNVSGEILGAMAAVERAIELKLPEVTIYYDYMGIEMWAEGAWTVSYTHLLDRKLSEKRVFPAIDIVKSGTRREDLLLDPDELEAVEIMRKAYNGMRADEAVENILNMFARTKNNKEYIAMVKKNRII